MWTLVLAISIGSMTLPINVPFATERECKMHGKYAKTLSKSYKSLKVKWKCGFRMPEPNAVDPEFPYGQGTADG